MFGLLPLVSLLVACEGDGADTASGADLLSGVALGRRVSLDLRGVLPDEDELAALAEDPERLDALTEAWLADPRFPERMGWLWNDTLHTALWFEGYDRFGALEEEEWRSMGQEPLRLIAAVIEEGRPFSEIVTAEALLADPTLAGWWGLERAEGEGWTEARPTDGRPMAGLLSSTSLWSRYNADITNRNRMRANTLARSLLCADFFDLDVHFDFALSTEALERVESAVREEPSCLACHAALDPLAAFFGGFAERSQEEPLERFRAWSPWTADWYAAWTAPAYYGAPGANLTDLGEMIAADPRFWSCAASRFYERLVGAPPADADARAELGRRFAELDLDTAALVREILASEAYRADEPRLLGVERRGGALTAALGLPEGLGAPLDPLLWSAEHRVLGGGTDDDTVLEPSRTPSVSGQALSMWAARVAAPQALSLDAARAEGERLLWTVVEPFEAAPGEAATRAQLAAWHARLLGLPATAEGEAVDALWALWSELEEAGGPEAAWEGCLGALIRHPAGEIY